MKSDLALLLAVCCITIFLLCDGRYVFAGATALLTLAFASTLSLKYVAYRGEP